MIIGLPGMFLHCFGFTLDIAFPGCCHVSDYAWVDDVCSICFTGCLFVVVGLS